MKKERIFYLDFCRAISMFIIVTYHFYAHFAENNIKGFTIFSKGIWGIIGVTLFFIISGASLMHNYDEKLELKNYVKKRFLGIYPMFWIAYILLFLHIFYQTKTMSNGDIPLWRMSLSIIGMDGYLSSYLQTFYLIGEWFLGAIIILYIIFPILRILVKKFPKVTFIIMTIVNFAVLLFCKNTKMPLYQNIITCIYRFLLGMYIIKYLKNIKIWQMIIGLIVTIVLYLIPTQDYYIQVLISNIMGYCLFFVFAYIGTLLKNIKFQNVFKIVSKYSYAVFLVHHYIIIKIEGTFYGRELRVIEVLLLYTIIILTIAFFSKILYMLNKNVIKSLKPIETSNLEGNR